MHSNSLIPATCNDAWGFWNTMQAHAEAAWPLAIIAIAEITGESFQAARAFLDSRHGRHFADDVRNALHAGDALDQAIRAAISRWMLWRIGRDTSRIYGIPLNLPMLTGLVVHYGITDEASDA